MLLLLVLRPRPHFVLVLLISFLTGWLQGGDIRLDGRHLVKVLDTVDERLLLMRVLLVLEAK